MNCAPLLLQQCCFELHKLQSKESKKVQLARVAPLKIGSWKTLSDWLFTALHSIDAAATVVFCLVNPEVEDFFQLVLPKLDCVIFQTKHNSFLINTGASFLLHHTFNFLEAHILLIHCFL